MALAIGINRPALAKRKYELIWNVCTGLERKLVVEKNRSKGKFAGDKRWKNRCG